jgi:hypothetical protein
VRNEVLELFKIATFSRVLMLNKNDMAMWSPLGLLHGRNELDSDNFVRWSIFLILFFNIRLEHCALTYFLDISANVKRLHEKDVFCKVNETHFVLINHKQDFFQNVFLIDVNLFGIELEIASFAIKEGISIIRHYLLSWLRICAGCEFTVQFDVALYHSVGSCHELLPCFWIALVRFVGWLGVIH